ncbi:hypothetical protein WICPIJ_008710 [Wickerhamomyces pijperi]|uniref:Uncharacterized protein n=1 Tax=Wickerhamomyces pijperi TaxID=599730 RepID=A0A9P8PVU3_WICPI|nr:hypothetical protein WICPIJ_008710 [Wickerhamomyces pijperi]
MINWRIGLNERSCKELVAYWEHICIVALKLRTIVKTTSLCVSDVWIFGVFCVVNVIGDFIPRVFTFVMSIFVEMFDEERVANIREVTGL